MTGRAYSGMTQEPITSFFKSAGAAPASSAGPSSERCTQRALSLFDPYRASLRSWRSRSTDHVVDYITDDSILASDEKMRRLVSNYQGKVDAVLAFPPCVDLCVAGARWWKRKKESNPTFQQDAMNELKRLQKALDQIGAPYAIVLPSSGPILRQFPASFRTSPNEFGGWLDKTEEHPLFPLVVPKQDGYSKKTVVALGNGMRLPKRKPVEAHWVEKVLKTGKIKRFSPVMVHRKRREARRCPAFGLCHALLHRYGGGSARE
jgi:hypothetical protein